MAAIPKTLIMEVYPYGIRIFVEGSSRSYFIREDENKKGWLLIAEEVERQIIDVFSADLEGFGVGSLIELAGAIKQDPNTYYEMVTGEKIRVGKVIAEEN